MTSTRRTETFLITGGSSGLGLETALSLARLGMEVVVTARDTDRATAAAETVRRSSGNDQIHGLPLDLGSLASVRGFCDVFRSRFQRLDGVVANAGLLRMRYERSTDGIELNLAVNHLGHFLTIGQLMPLLRAAPRARIVLVASDAHRRGRFDPDHPTPPEGYRWLDAYANSKLALVSFGLALARRLEQTQITVNQIHPGLSRTRIWPSGTWGDRVFSGLVRLFAAPASRSAQGIIHLASSPELEGVTGRYLEKGLEMAPAPLAVDPVYQQRVWTWSERMTGAPFESP